MFLHWEDGETRWPYGEIPWKSPKMLKKNLGSGAKHLARSSDLKRTFFFILGQK